ncbi:MAG TPA: N-acetylneuraminate lyase, partial [Gemmataceae bacterium]|nr:N-acetylneuraminate lyase [Gemmataceae bacterium]
LYHQMMTSLKAGDLTAARADQFRAVELIGLMYRYGFLAAGKEAMRARGVDLGAVRLPNTDLTPPQAVNFRRELDAMGFAEMIRE